MSKAKISPRTWIQIGFTAISNGYVNGFLSRSLYHGGLKRLCEYYGIGMENSVAFGDSLNDLEIIEAAAIGIAMGNGREELKAAADYVTTDIGDDGIWNACVHFGLF